MTTRPQVFRVTMDDDEGMRKICRGTSALVCKEGSDEGAEEVHYHCLVYTNLQRQTLRKRVYDVLGPVPNISRKCAFTMPKEDLEGYKRYICKGVSAEKQPTVVLNTLEENVEELHEGYWREYAQSKEAAKEKKKKSKGRAEEFYDYFDTLLDRENYIGHRVDPYVNPAPGTLSITLCGWWVIKFFVDQGYTMPGKFQAHQIAVTAYARFYEGPEKNKMQNLMDYYWYLK